VIRQVLRHRRRRAQRFVNPAKIEMRDVQANRRKVEKLDGR